jgi:hypothetical protein
MVLAGAVIAGIVKLRGSLTRQPSGEAAAITIDKQRVTFASRTFDLASPPGEMPALTSGENAVCDSNFVSNATVGGETRQSDATHGTVTVTQAKMTLLLKITIWVPTDATAHVIEHEQGHRQISEYYYQTAEKLAERIAGRYVGKQVDIAGADLQAESSKVLREMASQITAEYNKELNPEPTQLLYDDITDHSRNGVEAKDAVDHAIKNAVVEAPRQSALR